MKVTKNVVGNTITLQRYTDTKGFVPAEPAAAYAVMRSGKILYNLTASQMDEIMSRHVSRGSDDDSNARLKFEELLGQEHIAKNIFEAGLDEIVQLRGQVETLEKSMVDEITKAKAPLRGALRGAAEIVHAGRFHTVKEFANCLDDWCVNMRAIIG